MDAFKRYSLYSLIALFVAIPQAYAQNFPESAQPGVIERELSREDVELSLEKKFPTVELDLPEQELIIDKNVRVFAKEINITGNTVVKTSYLDEIKQNYLNQELGLEELSNLIQEIRVLYRAKGYFLVKPYLPPQEITSGTIQINLLEGKLGKLEIQGNEHYPEKFIRRYLKLTNRGVMNYNRLLTSLALLNENPGMNARAVFRTGSEPGTADLVIMIKDYGKLLAFSFDYNNFGSRFVSRYRFGHQGKINNVFLPGDEIRLRGALGTPMENLRFGKIDYTIPINGYGTRIGMSATGTRYEASREFAQFGTKGSAYVYSVDMEQPILRTRTLNFDFRFGMDYKQIRNQQQPSFLNKDYLRTIREEFVLDWLDPWKGRTYFVFGMVTGVDIFSASPQNSQTISNPGAGGIFHKFNFGLSRVQKLPYQMLLFTRGAAQFTQHTLPSSEQISMGGAETVRGYPQSDYLADEGYVMNIELFFPPPVVGGWKVPFFDRYLDEMVQFIGFFDHGTGLQNNPSPGEQGTRSLASVGAGVRIDVPYIDTSVRLDWGFPVISSPEPGDDTHSTFYIQVTNNWLKFPRDATDL